MYPRRPERKTGVRSHWNSSALVLQMTPQIDNLPFQKRGIVEIWVMGLTCCPVDPAHSHLMWLTISSVLGRILPHFSHRTALLLVPPISFTDFRLTPVTAMYSRSDICTEILVSSAVVNHSKGYSILLSKSKGFIQLHQLREHFRSQQ